jgi:hypothetical protein
VNTPEVAIKPRRKPPSAGRGRKKGELNKVTRDVREMIAVVALKNASKIDAWLARVARKNPAQAIDLYLRMIEYHIPKLSRQEIVRPLPGAGKVIDSSQLTAEQREQLRQMILGQQSPELLEQVAPTVLEPVGLAQAQVIDSVEEHGSTSEGGE